MIDYKLLTNFQLITFVLGIAFSVLSIAMVFYSLRHPNGFRNLFLKILFLIVLPIVTFIMWFACAFAAYGLFESSELYIMLLSIGCGIALGGIAVLIAWLIHAFAFKKEHKEEETLIEVEEDAEKEPEIKLIEGPKAPEQLEDAEQAEVIEGENEQEAEAEQTEETEAEPTEDAETETEEAEKTETENDETEE